MSEVWCVSSSSDHFASKGTDQKMAFSSLHNRDRCNSVQEVDSMFAANVQGLSNISLLSNKSGNIGAPQAYSEYSLFNSDGLPPPVSNSSNEQSKPMTRSSSSETFWNGSENASRSRGFHLGFDLSESSDQNKFETMSGVMASRNEKDRIAAAIWAHLPESAPPAQPKAIGAEIRRNASQATTLDMQQNAIRLIQSNKPMQSGPVHINGIAHSLPPPRQQMSAAPIQLHQQVTIPPTWTTQGQIVTLLPGATVQNGQQVFRAPLIQPRIVNPALISINQNLSHASRNDINNIAVTSSSRPSFNCLNVSSVAPTLTAPQLHSAIGQINELTVHALNQTAAMIMDRHQLESKLLHYAPEQFRSVYNELALPEPLEPITGRKETSGVDMLLTAQLRENLRINTLVRRIKVVVQLAPNSVGTQALDKWTDDVRNFQAFLMKMHERARRMHLSSTIAATLYSSGDSATRGNDSALLANMLNELIASTLNARQALFLLGERAISLLTTSNQRKSISPNARDRSSSVLSSEIHRPVSSFAHQPIPVNPESAQQLWRQLGQLPSHGFSQ